MIVINSSAVIAIIEGEALAEILTRRIVDDRIGQRCMSTATYLETGTVLAGRQKTAPLSAVDILDGFLSSVSIDLVPVDEEQARVALKARIEFGRGFKSGAQLNYGDCFSYALAKARSAPLLYIGNDFDKTDVARALA